MKSFLRVLTVHTVMTVFSMLFAQSASHPLSLNGLDQSMIADIRSRGMGGAITASGNTASVLFVNPAGLAQITGMEIRIGGLSVATKQQQTQEWVPNRLYTGLSLMMEDKWGDIKSPTDTNGVPIKDQWEQLQKPFDAIGPQWSRNTNHMLPLSVAVAIPVTIDDVRIVFGIGGSQMIDLNHYFQDNNVTSPLLGQYRPQPLPELQPGDTLRARWFQYIRNREGLVWGITPAIGVEYEGVSVGASATYYSGSSDDNEYRFDRGFMTFIYNRFKVQDTIKFASTRIGTSTYTGFGVTFGMKIEQPQYALAGSLQLPYTLNREYSRTYSSREDVIIISKKYDLSRTEDSVQTTIVTSDETGSEKVFFPYAYSIGLMLKPIPNWVLSFDFEARNLNNVEHTLSNGAVGKPWVTASSIRLGAEYQWMEWLAFRTGYREVPQVFSPEGAAIIGDPAMMSIYAVGAGLSLFGTEIDIAYEFAQLRYRDLWQSNINQNTRQQNRLLFALGYRF